MNIYVNFKKKLQQKKLNSSKEQALSWCLHRTKIQFDKKERKKIYCLLRQVLKFNFLLHVLNYYVNNNNIKYRLGIFKHYTRCVRLKAKILIIIKSVDTVFCFLKVCHNHLPLNLDYSKCIANTTIQADFYQFDLRCKQLYIKCLLTIINLCACFIWNLCSKLTL